MRIRKASLQDIPQCVALCQIEEFKSPGDTYPDEQFLKESIASGVFLVAAEGELVLGLALGYKLTPHSVYFDLLTVSEEARGKGVGKALMDGFRETLRKQGVKDYFLIALSANEKTRAFYRREGLEEGETYVLFQEKLQVRKPIAQGGCRATPLKIP